MPLLVLALGSWSLLQLGYPNSTRSSSTASSDEPPAEPASRLAALLEEEEGLKPQPVVQLAQLESFDSFASSSIQLLGVEASFHQRFLGLDSADNSRPSSRFTF